MQLVFMGLVMGVAFAAPPGAVTAETLRRGARGGFGIALGVQLGSLIGDATYALFALAGLAAFAQVPILRVILGAFGAVFLLYLAWSALTAPLVSVPQDPPPQSVGTVDRFDRRRLLRGTNPARTDSDSSHIGTRRGAVEAFLSGLAISLANPWAIAFWLSLGGALTAYGLANAGPQQTAVFFSSFMLGSALWALALSAAVGRLQTGFRRRPGLYRVVSMVCAVALGAFGLAAASRTISFVLGI